MTIDTTRRRLHTPSLGQSITALRRNRAAAAAASGDGSGTDAGIMTFFHMESCIDIGSKATAIECVRGSSLMNATFVSLFA